MRGGEGAKSLEEDKSCGGNPCPWDFESIQIYPRKSGTFASQNPPKYSLIIHYFNIYAIPKKLVTSGGETLSWHDILNNMKVPL